MYSTENVILGKSPVTGEYIAIDVNGNIINRSNRKWLSDRPTHNRTELLEKLLPMIVPEANARLGSVGLRYCKDCETWLEFGYYLDDDDYYCEACLAEHYTAEEWDRRCEENFDYCYYSEMDLADSFMPDTIE